MESPYTSSAFVGLAPEIVAGVFFMLVLGVGVFAPRARLLYGGIAALGAAAAFAVSVVLLVVGFEGGFFDGGYAVDSFALYFKLIVAGSAFFTVIAASRWAEETGDGPEYLALILGVAFGAMLLVSMRDLFGIFVALELATIPSYALVAFDRRRRESSEGGMKYLITGVVASSILLYGLVLIYGVSGSANLSEVAQTFSGALSPVALLGLILAISGFAFKVSAVPFHFWTPDAYQGAPTTAAAFLSVAPKAATFGVLLRLLVEGMGGAAQTWVPLMIFFAIVSMFVGNLFALQQRNVRRMLAYSSVAHSGYILAAFAALQGAGAELAVQAVLIYSAAYAFMNLGAFLVIDLVGEDISSYSGLWRSRPAVAASMGVFMAALVGIPPLSGFFGKLWVILAGVGSGSIAVYVVVGVLVINSVLSVPYYFGVMRSMFLDDPAEAAVGEPKPDAGLTFSVYALAVLTTLFFLFVGALAAVAGSSGLL